MIFFLNSMKNNRIEKMDTSIAAMTKHGLKQINLSLFLISINFKTESFFPYQNEFFILSIGVSIKLLIWDSKLMKNEVSPFQLSIISSE